MLWILTGNSRAYLLDCVAGFIADFCRTSFEYLEQKNKTCNLHVLRRLEGSCFRCFYIVLGHFVFLRRVAQELKDQSSDTLKEWRQELTACAVVATAELCSAASAAADLSSSSLFLSFAFLRSASRQIRSAVMSAGLTPPTLVAWPTVCGLTC